MDSSKAAVRCHGGFYLSESGPTVQNLFKTSLTFIILSALLAVFLSFLAWPGEMIAPFRLQMLLGLLLLVGLASALRFPHLAVFAAAVAALNVMPMALRLTTRMVLPTPSAAAGLTLVSSNVLCDNTAYERVVAMVRREDPDIFVAVETTPDWIDHLDVIKDRYTYSFTPARLGVFGLSVYAKRSFQAQLLHLGSRQMPLARLEFRDYVVYAVHTMPPATAAMTDDNRVYLQQLADLAGQELKPVILAGDFNSTLWSRNMAPFLRGRWQWPHGSGMAYSWPAQTAVLGIQIDQVLTRGFKAGRYRTLEGVGSDHYPVRADLAL